MAPTDSISVHLVLHAAGIAPSFLLSSGLTGTAAALWCYPLGPEKFAQLCVQALPAMVEVASEEQLTQVILPALLARAEDPVPNVKFNVCKVLEV